MCAPPILQGSEPITADSSRRSYLVDIGRDAELLAFIALLEAGREAQLTHHQHHFDLLTTDGWAFEVKTASWPHCPGVAIHRKKLRAKRDWADTHGYKAGVAAVNLGTGEVRWYPALKCVHWDDMTVIPPR